MYPCRGREHVCLLNKTTCLLVGQEDMSSCWTRNMCSCWTRQHVFLLKNTTWEPSGRHLGGSRRLQEAPGGSGRQKVIHLSAIMQQVPWNVNFTLCFWGYHSLWLHIYSKIWAAALWRIPQTLQGPFTNTVRTPTAEDCLGKFVREPGQVESLLEGHLCGTSDIVQANQPS